MNRRYWGLLLGWLMATPLSAAQLVLVQGYLSTSQVWQKTGITEILHQNDWQDGGVLYRNNHKVMRSSAPESASEKTYYRVELPYEAGIRQQAWFLRDYLQFVQNSQPGEPIYLVGHSAGGVVARYVMVQHPELMIQKLVTFSSPHLGTTSATLGRLLGNSPMAMFAPMMGAQTLNRSQGLYRDLEPESEGNLLHWLNRQRHPVSEYVSFVREHNSSGLGDLVVPAHSQNLQNVKALGKRAQKYTVTGGHALSRDDGVRLMQVLDPVLAATGTI